MARRERVKGESLGSLYRTLCAEASGGKKDVRRERLLIMEQLGYLKRKTRTAPASTLHLGRFARRRKPPDPKPPQDSKREARERAENRRKLLYSEGVSGALRKIQQLQLKDRPVPPHLWKSLSQAQNAKHLLPTLPDPGPGQYKVIPVRSKGLKRTMGSVPKGVTLLNPLASPPRPPPGPGAYLPLTSQKKTSGYSLVGKDRRVGARGKLPKAKAPSLLRQINAGLEGFEEEEDPDAWTKLEYWFPPKIVERQLVPPADRKSVV